MDVGAVNTRFWNKTRFWITFAADRSFYYISKLDYGTLFEQIFLNIRYFSIIVGFFYDFVINLINDRF